MSTITRMSPLSTLTSLSLLLHRSLALPEVDIEYGVRLYTGYQVLRAFPHTVDQRAALVSLGNSVDFWTEIGPASKQVDIMVEPEDVTRITNFLKISDIPFEVMIRDLQADIEKENSIDPWESSNKIDPWDSSTALTQIIRTKRQNKQRLRPRPRQGMQFPLPTFSLWHPFSGQTQTRQRRKPQDLSQFHLQIPSKDATITSFPISSSSSPHPGVSPCSGTGMSWTQYQSARTIQSWMSCLAANYPHKTKLITIGKSSEGRPLQVMKIGSGDSSKPAVFIDGGIHAREWVSPAAVTYLIHRMVEAEGEFSKELDTYNIYVLPLANPDGYEYSRDHDRMWRKTRSRTGKRNFLGQECRGVDMNRNFGYHWGGYGASDDACKETFMGKTPFSEPETMAMRDFLMREAADFKLYLTFHSYGQYILYPWGYDTLDTRDHSELHRVGEAAVRALKHGQGVNYQLGSAAKMLYPASGGSDDWVKGGAGIKYSYTIELPDTGRFGFILPAKFIKNVSLQTSTAVKSMLGAVRESLPK